MKDKISASEVRLYNKRRIFRTLIRSGMITKQELAAETQLSIPKITQVLSELVGSGLVQECGIQESRGGRRPAAFCAVADARLAAGIDISRNHLNFSVVNLRGEVIVNERIRCSLTIDPSFYEKLYVRFMQFLGEHSVSYDKLIGLGVSLAGIISADQDFLAYSHVLQTDAPFDLRPFRRLLKIPVAFFNDANVACMAECYTGMAPSSFNFLSLSNTVGGAVVIDNRIVPGASGRCGEAGHLLIVPGGRKCYCGKRGHYDPYGSALTLADAADGSLADFFAGLEEGNTEYKQVFDEYIHYLALLASNLHLWSDLPIVLGGYTASFLAPYVDRLKKEMSDLTIFDEEEEYLYLSSYRFEASSVGCARYFSEQFLDSL